MIFTTLKANVTPQALSNGWKAAQLCLLDGQNGRLFAGASTTSASMSQEVCTDFCALKGFNQAGVEYGTGTCSRRRAPLLTNRPRAPTTDLVSFSFFSLTECYCTSGLDLASATRSSDCDTACAGAQTEVCGGGNALWVLTK
jgi:hypothetical protein